MDAKSISMISSFLTKSVVVFGVEAQLLHVATAVFVATVVLVLLALVSMNNKPSHKIAMDPEVWHSFPLVGIEELSHDVRKYTFALPSPDHRLGLPVGQHISLKYVDENGKEVQRSYTPVSSDDDYGHVEFMIKVYFKNTHPRFPEGGKMSQHLDSLKIGDTMLMKGPKGHLTYQGRGKFTIKKRNNLTQYRKKKIGMIAGGTGITPMLQVIHAILKDPKDTTELWLMFGNQTEEDILMRKELEAIPSDRLHLFYTLDRPPADWKYGSGFVTEAMCRDHLPPAGDDTMIFMCGPPPMIKSIENHLKNLNMNESQFFSF